MISNMNFSLIKKATFKKSVVIFFALVLSISLNKNIYSQVYIPKDIKKNLHFGILRSGYILIDENNGGDETEEKFCINYIKKRYGNDYQGRFYYFPEKKGEFYKYTKYNLGDNFYVASSNEIIKSKVIGYAISAPIEVLRFNTVLSGAGEISNEKYLSNDFYPVMICSKNEIKTRISYNQIDDAMMVAKLSKNVIDKANNVDIINDDNLQYKYEKENEPRTSTKILKGNFLNSGKQEYVVSYHKVYSQLCISYSAIVSEDGYILEDVTKILNVGRHFICFGISDYNSDGLNEIIAEDGYYEGGGYVLFEFNGLYFDIIVEGFDDGL